MQLWTILIEIIWQLKLAFPNQKNFLWVVVIISSFCVRPDVGGVSSFMRGYWLTGRCYPALLRAFHSTAVKLPLLRQVWFQVILKLFSSTLVCFQGRRVIIADGIKNPKEGRRMPGVKCCHQESSNNSKAEFVMAHSCQALAILVQAVGGFFAVPITCAIHEGVVFSNRDKRTLQDKLLELLGQTACGEYYLLADAAYACGKLSKGLLKGGNHLISRLRTNAVAYELTSNAYKKRGRPKLYGAKVKLRDFFSKPELFESIPSPLAHEEKISLRVCTLDLIWKPLGRLVRIVLVIHPLRGKWILISTDLWLEASEIIQLYGCRFRIELMFKSLVYLTRAFAYRFWMKGMDKIKRFGGNQYPHRKTEEYREKLRRKINAYELFMQLGFIALGVEQYLACNYHKLVWTSFGGWLRTMRPDISPSELVVSEALKTHLPEFLAGLPEGDILKKFLADKLDWSRCPFYRVAS